MKKILTCLLAGIMSITALTACGTTNEVNSNSKSEDNLNIVCTIFPQYDWVTQLTADTNVNITMLLDNGVDIHSYQPTADDIIKISSADMVVYVGGESDSWVEDVLKNSDNPDRTAVKMLDILDTVYEEEIIEGMQNEDDHEHDHDHDHEDNEAEQDEHVWLSMKNAVKICSHLKDKLCEIDSANADLYRKNCDNYISELNALDERYQQMTASAMQNTLLFADRFPFRYLTEEYGISYYAAFPGCSAETEASFETIAFLSQKLDEHGLNAVLTIDGSDQKVAATVIENSASKNQTILTLNSMQSITSKNAADGITYLSIMESNLEILRTAMN